MQTIRTVREWNQEGNVKIQILVYLEWFSKCKKYFSTLSLDIYCTLTVFWTLQFNFYSRISIFPPPRGGGVREINIFSLVGWNIGLYKKYLYLKHGYNKTFAELEESIKNRVSHRRKALDKIILSLESILNSWFITISMATT